MGLFGHGGGLSKLAHGGKKVAQTAISAVPGALTGLATGGVPGAILGGLSGIATAYNEQQATNAANEQTWAMMNAQNTFNAQEAQKTRDWQTEMANTAHQREMKDLEAAGLNPVLAANDGGAVPAGATASGSMGNVQKADAIGAMQTALQERRQEAEIANIEADTYSKEKMAGKTDTEIKLNEMSLKLEPVKQQVENELLRAQTKTQKAEAAKIYKDIKELEQIIEKAQLELDDIKNSGGYPSDSEKTRIIRRAYKKVQDFKKEYGNRSIARKIGLSDWLEKVLL